MLFLEKLLVPTKMTVMLAGICTLILTMGLGHYAFAPMIPYMLDQTGMTLGLSWLLVVCSYVGFLGGLVIVWLVHNNVKLKDFIYRYALFITVASTAAMAIIDHTIIYAISRLFAGLAAAFGLVLSIDLILRWLDLNNEKKDLKLFFTGIGFSVLVSAILVALMSCFEWRGQWVSLIIFGFLLAIPAFVLMPLPKAEQLESEIKTKDPESSNWLMLTLILACAGSSNLLNPIFSSLITKYITVENEITYMWFWLGLAAVVAPFFWDLLADLLGSVKKSMTIAFAILILSNVLMSVSLSGLSSLFFGFSFVGIVFLIMKLLIENYSTRLLAQLVVGFGVVQIISPVIAGGIANLTGSFGLALYFINGVLLFGIICIEKMDSK